MPEDFQAINALMEQLREGDGETATELVPRIYDELRVLARSAMRGERVDHTLGVTGLVNEAWIALARQTGARWDSRRAFYAMATKVMRHVLIDHARRRSRKKRGGDFDRVPFEIIETSLERDVSVAEYSDVNQGLEALREHDPVSAEIVDLRFFGGLTLREIGEVVDLTRSQVDTRLRAAMAWLRHRLGEDDIAEA